MSDGVSSGSTERTGPEAVLGGGTGASPPDPSGAPGVAAIRELIDSMVEQWVEPVQNLAALARSGVAVVLGDTVEEYRATAEQLTKPETWDKVSESIGAGVREAKEKLPPEVRVHGTNALANAGLTKEAVTDNVTLGILKGQELVARATGKEHDSAALEQMSRVHGRHKQEHREHLEKKQRLQRERARRPKATRILSQEPISLSPSLKQYVRDHWQPLGFPYTMVSGRQAVDYIEGKVSEGYKSYVISAARSFAEQAISEREDIDLIEELLTVNLQLNGGAVESLSALRALAGQKKRSDVQEVIDRLLAPPLDESESSDDISGSEGTSHSDEGESSGEQVPLRQVVASNVDRALDVESDADEESFDLAPEAKRIATAASYAARLLPREALNQGILLGKNLGINPTKMLEAGGYPKELAGEVVAEVAETFPKELANRDRQPSAPRLPGLSKALKKEPPSSKGPRSSSSSSESDADLYSDRREEISSSTRPSSPATRSRPSTASPESSGWGVRIGAIAIIAIPMIVALGGSIAAYRFGGRALLSRYL